MDAHRITVVSWRALRLLRPQADRRSPVATKEIVDGLASLSLDLVNPSPAKRVQKLSIEREAPFERTDDEVQVVELSHPVVLAPTIEPLPTHV
jgi:hypothetical protein